MQRLPATGSLAVELRVLMQLRALPPSVAWFHLRARARARRSRDEFSLLSASRPAKVATLLAVADGRREVAELGTATGWTAAALALADRKRQVTTYDPVDRPERARYLDLLGGPTRARITYLPEPGALHPHPVELLYIDSSHDEHETIAEVEAWAPQLATGALIVFDDYTHPEYPGVSAAIRTLELDGSERDGLFIHQVRSSRWSGPGRS
jgi:predicted O-methyltransferase YrrM